MEEILIRKLHEYISENNPELLFQLEEDGEVVEYLSNKIKIVNSLLNPANRTQPEYIIMETCMDILTRDLKPSKYNFIATILEEEFADFHKRFQETGILQFELLNAIRKCQPVFEELHFSENEEDNRFLRFAITGAVGNYLNRLISENEQVNDGLQQPTKVKR